MKSTMKRALSLILTALMLLMLLPGGMAEEMNTASAPVIPGLSDGGALVGEVLGESAEKTAAELLYDRLMACETIDEINAMLDGLTEEEEVAMDAFTVEQQDDLSLKISRLGGYEISTLDTQYVSRSYSIQAGNSTTVDDITVDNDTFGYSCNENGISASRNSSGNGYTINVTSSVKAGTYTLTATYKSTSSVLWWTTTTDYVDTVTITVTAVDTSNKNVRLDAVLDHTIATYAYYENGEWHWGDTYRHGQTFSIYYHGDTDSVKYVVYFAKPEKNYLLTTFSLKSDSQTEFDLYSVDNYSNSQIKDFTGLSALVSEAKDMGYLTLNGYTTSSAASPPTQVHFIHYFNAVQPTLNVEAIPDKQDVKPGDTVTFTVTVKPQVVLGTDQTATIEKLEVSELVINGITYENVILVSNGDGTYKTTLNYDVTASDWTIGSIILTVNANVTYQYVLPVKDRKNVSSKIQTISVVASTGDEVVRLADAYGVGYELRFDAPEGVTPPMQTEENTDGIPVAPIDSERYFEGSSVKVASYNREDVVDKANGGTWKFSGWAYADRKDYDEDDEIEMPQQNGILLVGIWKFEKNLHDVTIVKEVTGNMGAWDKEFQFTVSAEDNFTLADADASFKLKHDGTHTIAKVTEGTTLTITEIPEGYSVSVTTVKTGDTVAEPQKVEKEINSEEGKATFKIEITEPTTITFTNDKSATPDTGVLLDSLPYLLILAVVVIVIVLSILRKRRNDD